MLKKYTFWTKTSAVIMLLTGGIHTITLFVTPAPADETQKQLMELMNGYKINFGGGFVRSMEELVTALSSCFSLMYLLGGVLLFYLVRKCDAQTMKGVLSICIIFFGINFGINLAFTFLPPIVLTGLSFFTLLIARLTVK